MKKILIILFGLFLFIFNSCSNGNGFGNVTNTKNSFSVVSWNVQTFFDANNDGSEYADFLKSKTWNEEMYSERVNRLCKVMTTLNADIYVFEEIENEAVIQDICNGLSAHKWNSTGIWNYACFSKEPESSIGCAVISKYELWDLSNHSIEDGSPKVQQPALRAIGKVKVKIGNKDFVLFINHWKSKSSGEFETEIWRIKQESILTNLVCETVEENQNCPILICGDFNKSIEEFEYIDSVEKGNVLLKSKYPYDDQAIAVFSPWYDEHGNYTCNTGSYYYKNSWEYIDNFFVYGNFDILDFEACTDDLWTKDNNIPNGFKIYTGEGYSDHLPIKITLQFKN